jgi:hypothetical protein
MVPYQTPFLFYLIYIKYLDGLFPSIDGYFPTITNNTKLTAIGIIFMKGLILSTF